MLSKVEFGVTQSVLSRIFQSGVQPFVVPDVVYFGSLSWSEQKSDKRVLKTIQWSYISFLQDHYTYHVRSISFIPKLSLTV